MSNNTNASPVEPVLDTVVQMNVVSVIAPSLVTVFAVSVTATVASMLAKRATNAVLDWMDE